MKKTITALTVGFALSAGMAQADARSAAYSKMMTLFNSGQAALAHEFANCPVYWASETQLYAIVAADGDDAINAALDDVFQNSPSAINCVIDVINRYDLIEGDLPVDVVAG